MTDELIKEVKLQTIKLGGIEYQLSPLNFNIMTYIEEEFNCNFSEFGSLMMSGKFKQITMMRKLLYIFLKDNYPDLTITDIGKQVTIDNANDIDTAIGRALIGDAYTEVKDKVVKKAKK